MRRILIPVAAASIAVGGVASTARAGTENQVFSATSTGFSIDTLGTTLSATDHGAIAVVRPDGSPDVARARADQRFSPLFTSGGEMTVEADEPGEEQQQRAPSCTFTNLAWLPGVRVPHDVACPMLSASWSADGAPDVRSHGSQLTFDLAMSELLQAFALDGLSGDHEPEANDGLDDRIIDAAANKLPRDTPGRRDADDLAEDLLGSHATVRVSMGGSAAEVVSGQTRVAARARSQGVRVELLPRDTTDGRFGDAGRYGGALDDPEAGDPLLLIVLGEASGEASRSRSGTGAPSVRGVGAVARIRVGDGYPLSAWLFREVAENLGFHRLFVDHELARPDGWVRSEGRAGVTYDPATGDFVVQGPGAVTLLVGTPLQSRITLSEVELGTAAFRASGSSLELFLGVNGGIHLRTSDVAGSVL